MRAGLLRHRVAIVEDVVAGQDGTGQETVTATTRATVWGEVKPLSGKELWRAQQIQPEVTHQVTVRYTSDLVPERHLVHDGRSLHILGISDRDERKIEQTLLCKERV